PAMSPKPGSLMPKMPCAAGVAVTSLMSAKLLRTPPARRRGRAFKRLRHENWRGARRSSGQPIPPGKFCPVHGYRGVNRPGKVAPEHVTLLQKHKALSADGEGLRLPRAYRGNQPGSSTVLMTWMTPFDCITLAMVTSAVSPLASMTQSLP